MKEYRATITINVFVNADTQEEADQKFEDMEMIFKDEDGNHYDSDIIDWDIEEVID